jgi:hypothetical protein
MALNKTSPDGVVHVHVLVIVLAAALALAASCKKDEPPPASAEDSLLETAIETQGGIVKLKTGSSFSARYESPSIGSKVKATIQQKAGSVCLHYTTPAGDYAVTQVAADGQCWQQIDLAVIPCTKPLADHTTRLARLLEASWLWPLKERKDRKVKAAKVEIPGKSGDGLVVLGEGGEEIGALAVDKISGLVTGLKMQTTVGGQTGELVGVLSQFEKACGVEMPMKREYTFEGKPFASEKLSGVICEVADDKVFLPPEQVKNGTVEIKNTANLDLACTKLKGSFSGIPPVLRKLVDHLVKKEIPVEGPPMLVLRRGPPQVRQPSQFLTDVCIPVSKKAWTYPEAEWKGEFSLFERLGDEYLRAFGIGEYEKTAVELAVLLAKDAKAKGRVPTGAPLQILYMPPDSPPDKQVSEMLQPLE